MYNRYKFSCKGCVNRYVGCHSTCQDYINAKKQGDIDKDIIRAGRRKEYDYRSFIISSFERSQKSRR